MNTAETDGAGDAGNDALRDRIVDCAVDLAEESAWESVRLHQIAERLGIELADIQGCFAEKDQLIDAWFDRADRAALVASRETGFEALSAPGRLKRVMLAWFDHLAPHRRVTREMIHAKAEFGHVHMQVPALIRVSRTVQWFREAAGYSDALPIRAIAESAHTGIYLLSFVFWMRDPSPHSQRTRNLLDRLLPDGGGCPTPWSLR